MSQHTIIENHLPFMQKNVSKKKIFIGTPAYQGQVHVHYAMMLLDMNEILRAQGFEVLVRLPVGGSLLVADRNRLIEAFWQSGADYMICLDSDLAFDPRYILRFLESDKDFVGGVYPSRDGKGFNFRPCVEDDGRIVMDQFGLLKMEYIPAGCMMFKREVIAKMREDFSDLYYEPKDPLNKQEAAFCFFNTEVWDGEFWGEDYVFCRRVRESGFDIWVDPTIEFNHAGVFGSLMQSLTTDPNKAQKR